MNAAIRRITYTATLLAGIALGATWHALNLNF